MTSTATPSTDISVGVFTDPAGLDANSAFVVRFLDALHSLEAIRTCQQRTRALLGVRPGFNLLDVGCGAGAFAIETAALIGDTGGVVGVDHSDTLLHVARARAMLANQAVSFLQGDALHLPFADEVFDGCRSERVLQYLDEPTQALAEMARVLKPGGWLAAAEVDWDSCVDDLAGIDRSAYRTAIHAFADRAGNGWIGRQLRRRFLNLGLEEVTCEGFVVIITDANVMLRDLGWLGDVSRVASDGVISAEAAANIVAAAEAAAQRDRYFSAFTQFLVSGRKSVARG